MSATLSYDSPPDRHPGRWTLNRAGIVNVWHYFDAEFQATGGRLILRGTNGAGKSRAMEMLVPFLLDADKRRMDATGSGKVSIEDLMKTGANGATNRLGYLWLELARDVDGSAEYLTLGAYLRWSGGTSRVDVRYFTTPLRVGADLPLVDAGRAPLARDRLTDLIGAERLSESPDAHREAVRTQVFGLHGDSGRERFDGLRQLLHTLRAPDMGNRIDEGQLPRLLRDAMPPLSQASLDAAGEKLDGLTETRHELDRLERSVELVGTFLGVYQRYSADVLRRTATDLLEAEATAATSAQEAKAKAAEAASLADQRDTARRSQSEHNDAAEQLRRAIDGMKSRDVFKTAEDLRARDSEVTALAAACDAELGRAADARRYEQTAVDGADAQADAVRREADRVGINELQTLAASADVPHNAVDLLSVTITGGTVTGGSIRLTRDGEQAPVSRRGPADLVVTPEPADVSASVKAVGDAAAERAEHAERRRAEADRLASELRQVDLLERDAEAAAVRAEDERRDVERAGGELRAAADALVAAWRTHVQSADAPQAEWPSALAAALADPDAVLAAEFDPLALDAAAEFAARPTVDASARELADLDTRQRADDDTQRALEQEAVELRAARDPAPPDAPWLGPARGGHPLWRCVDFAAGVEASRQAALEAALLASGLLTAAVTADGSVVAATGEILLTPGVAVAERSITAALTPDPDGPLPASVIDAVLAGIGLDDDAASVAVHSDGRWRNGPLRGRHEQAAAGYIGATARAARRAARLAEIDDLIAELERRRGERSATIAAVRDRVTRLRGWVTAAPRTQAFVTALAAVARAEERADDAQKEASRAASVARQRRSVWAVDNHTHIESCRLHTLPSGPGELRTAHSAAVAARGAAGRVVDALARVDDAVERHRNLVATLADLVEARRTAEARADAAWEAWSEPAAEVAAIHQTLDIEVAQLNAEIERSNGAWRAERGEAGRQGRLADELTARHTALAADAAVARQRVIDDRAVATNREQRLRRVVALPGLVAAAAPDAALPTGDAIELATALDATITRHGPAASDQTLMLAFQTFDREIQGRLDVRDNPIDGIHLIEVTGSGDDRTLAGAHRELTARVEKGREALSERERGVFTRFVLGGVAEELRNRLAQAETLVAAMNDSLDSVRTSHNIGVSLRWRLADAADDDVKRIKTLVARADQVRSEAQNDELTGLLRRRVEALHALDPSSGYASHLAVALDYRQWHSVEVTILGPDPGQSRTLSTRAKLSQGETRFVSYVTLFAAADGFLRGLPDPRGLRLILLDDAFAKVDDPTVAELMGLLVRLDLDFVMTGHALWGCYPQVPSVDVYEVRRREGGPAITTHVHWDGTTRHLQAAG